jgi:hypothetical protein
MNEGFGNQLLEPSVTNPPKQEEEKRDLDSPAERWRLAHYTTQYFACYHCIGPCNLYMAPTTKQRGGGGGGDHGRLFIQGDATQKGLTWGHTRQGNVAI